MIEVLGCIVEVGDEPESDSELPMSFEEVEQFAPGASVNFEWDSDWKVACA